MCLIHLDIWMFIGFSTGSVQKTQELWVQSLSQEEPLEKDIETHSSILAWEVEPGGLYSPWGHKELDMTERLTLRWTFGCLE